jgi:hypothetical protein
MLNLLNMKIIKSIAYLILGIIIINSCKNETDMEKPIINLDNEHAFPVNCDTIYFGEAFNLNVLFSDNAELGSFSIDIHNNFDHHSHSTEVTECVSDSAKTPVNPFTFIDDYDIPEGKLEYETDLSVNIPSGNESGDYDEGDYHFYISLTDKEGWSVQKGLSIKMLYR